MLDWISVSFLCLFVISVSDSLEARDFIDLSQSRRSAEQYLPIETKDGESSAVQNLKIDTDRDPYNIHISFDAPVNPAGIILKYRLRVILMRINICTSTDYVIHETHSTKLHDYISKSRLKKCGSYMLEVAPVNGWHSNGGVGKTASVPFNYIMDHQSSWTVNTKFISSNSLTVSLGGLKEDKCENFGLIIEIKEERNHSNCLTRIISSLDCEDFKREVNSTQKCQIKQFITKYNPSSTYESFFSGIFQIGHIYEINIFKAANHITKVTQNSTEFAAPVDCFTDCYTPEQLYPGIRSVTKNGRVCLNWKDSKYKNIGSKANMCIFRYGSVPWCPDSNVFGLDLCDIPECSSIVSGTGCADVVVKQDDAQSLRIKWSRPPNLVTIIGYLVLLHNSDHFCEQVIIQLYNSYGNSDALESQIKNLYLSCKSKEDPSSITLQASFKDLHQNRSYNVYIAPIMSLSSVGEIRNVTVRTTLAKPHIPNGVNYQLVTLHTITVFWEKNNETQSNSPAESYVAYITNRNTGLTVSSVTNTESVIFTNLQMCTEYCFVVSSKNMAGESGYTKEICTMTLAPKLEKSQLADPPSGYMTTQSLSWTYLGSDNCRKNYVVEYRVKFLPDKSNYSISSGTSIVLTGLTPNVNYTVRVRAELQKKTVNNENAGEYSAYKEFYTGKLRPNLSYYQHNIDKTNKILSISWGIEDKMRGSIFKYIIRVKNSFKFCMYSVLLASHSCIEPWCWNNVKYQHSKSLKKLIHCTVSLYGTMDEDQTSFNYLLTSERKFINFSVEIYGINLMGIHLLGETNTVAPALPGFSLQVLVWLAVFIVIFLILAILICFKIKGSPKKTEWKIKESHLRNRTKMFNQEWSRTDLQWISNLGLFNSKVAISAFPSYYGEISRNGSAELIEQFKKLTEEAKAQEVALELTFYVGKDMVNSKKNHSLNILPYDQTRVRVGQKGVPLNYINASYIPFENDETQIEYIAAQGPIQETLSDFWEMIWEQNIHYIINLTRMLESTKSLKYWPNDAERNILFGTENQFSVTLLKEKKKDTYVERKLSVLNTKYQTSRKIIQLHIDTWSDHSATDLSFFDKTLLRFHKIAKEDTIPPYLVHCSAGVGATGTFICIDRIIKQLLRGNQEIGIYDTVLKLRKYRNFMVEQQAQYNFIHEFLNHFLMKYMKIGVLEDDSPVSPLWVSFL